MAFFRSTSNPFHSAANPNLLSSSLEALPHNDALVSAAVSIIKHHRSKSRWSNLRSLLAATGDNHLTPSQFSQVSLQIRNTPHIVLRFFQFTIDHSLSTHSLFSYATVVHILSRSRLRHHALNLIKSAMSVFRESHLQNKPTPIAILEALISTYRVCDSAPFVFDLLAKACLDSKRMDDVIEIYAILKSKKVFLRTSTCNSLIELVSRSRGGLAGYDLYREIFVDNCGKGAIPDTTTLNVVMFGFCREGLVDKVEEVWKELVGIGCVPNVYSFNVLMETYCDAGRMDDAMRVWDEMGSKDLEFDAVAYNTIIGGLCREGEVGRAEDIYREMVISGVESTCVTFEHLINGYCKTGDLDSVMLLYKDMCRRSFSPASLTINAIVRLLNEKNEIFAALEFWRNSAKKHEVVLEKGNYKDLIRGLCYGGNMDEALNFQAEMVREGFEPCLEIYGSFIHGYTKLGNETMASKLRKEMVCKLMS